MAATTINSETVAAETIEEPISPLQSGPDHHHRKPFVSRVDFLLPLDDPMELKDLALSKSNFFWLRLNANKYYGKRNKALDRCVPRDLSLCLAQYDYLGSPFFATHSRPPPSDSERPKNAKRADRFLRLGRYDPFEARGSYEILKVPEVECSDVVEEVERKPSFPDDLTTSEFKAALRKCLVAAYVRDRWDGLNVEDAFKKFTKDHVEKLRGVEKERIPCTRRKQYRKSSAAPATSDGVQSPSDSSGGVSLPKLPRSRLASYGPGTLSEWKVRFWDTSVLDRMIMSGTSK